MCRLQYYATSAITFIILVLIFLNVKALVCYCYF